MNTDKAYAEKLASEYAPKETRKVVALKKLDSRAKRPANVFAYTFGVVMAAYTTYKIVMASVNLKRRKRSSNELIRLLRTISFIDALVSILSLQNTLLMVSTKGESVEMLHLSAITSAAIMLAVLAISIAAVRKGVVGLKRKE